VGDIRGEREGFQLPTNSAVADASGLDDPIAGDDEEEPATGLREGLPPNYRMRHDAHYVDDLMERSAPRIMHRTDDVMRENIRDSANPSAETDVVRPAAASPGYLNPAIARELADSLEAATACLSLNTGQTRGTFAGKVAKELLGVELHRATHVARAVAYLSAPPLPAPRDLLLSGLVHDVAAATDAARRMVGVRLDVGIADRESWMRADPQLLTLALSGAVDALLAEVFAPGVMRLAIKSASISPTLSIELSGTPASGLPRAERFFDGADGAHPWGPRAGLLLHAAAHIAGAHGGRAETRSAAPGEFTIAFVLPRR
jgi:hypothetical protein